jgi:hypothetical protein
VLQCTTRPEPRYCNFSYSALAFPDGDVGVGVFPESEEILVRDFSFGGIARLRVESGDPAS